MSSYVTPELLYFAVKWSELQFGVICPETAAKTRLPLRVIKLRSEGGKTHMCPLNCTSPQNGETHSREHQLSPKPWFYLWTFHWHMGGGGLCQPLQLYFVLNALVIRRPTVHQAPTGRGPHRERTVGCLEVDTHWHSVAFLCETSRCLWKISR